LIRSRSERGPTFWISLFALSTLRMSSVANRNRRAKRSVLRGGRSIHTAALAFSSADRISE